MTSYGGRTERLILTSIVQYFVVEQCSKLVSKRGEWGSIPDVSENVSISKIESDVGHEKRHAKSWSVVKISGSTRIFIVSCIALGTRNHKSDTYHRARTLRKYMNTEHSGNIMLH